MVNWLFIITVKDLGVIYLINVLFTYYYLIRVLLGYTRIWIPINNLNPNYILYVTSYSSKDRANHC